MTEDDEDGENDNNEEDDDYTFAPGTFATDRGWIFKISRDTRVFTATKPLAKIRFSDCDAARQCQGSPETPCRGTLANEPTCRLPPLSSIVSQGTVERH